ncbi:MAG: sigma-70 family RNA polymerase sigma factor [Acidobacteriota bacterium]
MEAIETVAVEMARSGNEEAFQSLVEFHSRRVFQLAYRLTGNEQDAEEVVQETFLRAYLQLERFESRAQFSTWLHRIAVNCAYDWMRKRRRHLEGRENPDRHDQSTLLRLASRRPSADRLLASQEIRQKVADTLGRLSLNERAAFVLRHFEGLSISEISRQLDLGTSATKHSIFRAVRKLREALGPLGDQP